jgi:hypothetical protein
MDPFCAARGSAMCSCSDDSGNKMAISKGNEGKRRGVYSGAVMFGGRWEKGRKIGGKNLQGIEWGYNSLTNTTNQNYIHISKTYLLLLISATRFGHFFGEGAKINKESKENVIFIGFI